MAASRTYLLAAVRAGCILVGYTGSVPIHITSPASRHHKTTRATPVDTIASTPFLRVFPPVFKGPSRSMEVDNVASLIISAHHQHARPSERQRLGLPSLSSGGEEAQIPIQ
ncbi:hypothetical protein V8C34DRAFT_292944 [Trichoderma compactum]